MLEALEKSSINNIINPRSQFGEMRYQLKIESLIFENKNTINEANQIYKTYTLARNDKEKDYAIIAFVRKFAEDPKGQQFSREFIYKQQLHSDESGQSQLEQQLEKLLTKHFDLSKQQVSSIQLPIQQYQYIFELNDQQYQDYQLLKSQNKVQEYLASLIKNRLNDPTFQKNQRQLEKQYNVENYYQQFRNEINSGLILIIVIKKQYTQREIEAYFNQKFYLDTEQKMLRLYGNSNQQTYYPLSHFNSFFSRQTREKIGVLSNVDQNDNKLLSQLQRLVFTQSNLTNLQMYFFLVELIQICKQFIEWNEIILNSLEKMEIGNNLPAEKSSIQRCKEQLENFYNSLDIRFQDQYFYEWNDSQKCKNCLLASVNNCALCQQTQKYYDEFNGDEHIKELFARDESIKGMILFQYCKEGIIIYQRVGIDIYLAAFVKYFKDSSISGELSQIIISDKEAHQEKVFIYKFDLSQGCQELYKSVVQKEKERQLIQEHFLKIAAVKMKRVYLNPSTRNNQDEKNKEI